MKSFTDIEQSKKLAEILPIESADMRYVPFGDTHPWFIEGDLIEADAVPCWSLAALLNIYPMVVGRDMDMYCCWQNSKNLYSRHYDNPVDACVEMILKLKEKNLL